nr:unnamed protein product [Spirometra erinaceieuropaei]
MFSLSPAPPRTPTTDSYVEKVVHNCTHAFVRCDHVRLLLESPYEGPLRVLARNAKACLIIRGDKEDVVIVNHVKAAVADEPPDLSQGQKCADPLTPVPPFSQSPAHSPFTSLALHPSFPHTSSPCMSTASNCNVILHHSTQSTLFDRTS